MLILQHHFCRNIWLLPIVQAFHSFVNGFICVFYVCPMILCSILNTHSHGVVCFSVFRTNKHTLASFWDNKNAIFINSHFHFLFSRILPRSHFHLLVYIHLIGRIWLLWDTHITLYQIFCHTIYESIAINAIDFLVVRLSELFCEQFTMNAFFATLIEH